MEVSNHVGENFRGRLDQCQLPDMAFSDLLLGSYFLILAGRNEADFSLTDMAMRAELSTPYSALYLRIPPHAHSNPNVDLLPVEPVEHEPLNGEDGNAGDEWLVGGAK